MIPEWFSCGVEVLQVGTTRTNSPKQWGCTLFNRLMPFKRACKSFALLTPFAKASWIKLGKLLQSIGKQLTRHLHFCCY
jgi:hypothetical protein